MSNNYFFHEVLILVYYKNNKTVANMLKMSFINNNSKYNYKSGFMSEVINI